MTVPVLTRTHSFNVASWLIVVLAVMMHPLPITAFASITAWGNRTLPSPIVAYFETTLEECCNTGVE